jgi:predicted NACHT family NTPase
MTAFPGLSREMAYEWIRFGRVAVLLDGLDEFNDERRADLALLLNRTFLRHYPDLVVVICSRTNEYAALKGNEQTRLRLRGCVHLEPLTDPQIATYLRDARAEGILGALPDDTALQELARTPLTLSMLVLAYGGVAPGDLPVARTLSEQRHNLFGSSGNSVGVPHILWYHWSCQPTVTT